jgi:hypothetical protein
VGGKVEGKDTGASEIDDYEGRCTRSRSDTRASDITMEDASTAAVMRLGTSSAGGLALPGTRYP